VNIAARGDGPVKRKCSMLTLIESFGKGPDFVQSYVFERDGLLGVKLTASRSKYSIPIGTGYS
jgi:hypothetical protein